MNNYLIEIVRQKWRYLTAILILLLLNIIMATFVSLYQTPSIADLQNKWGDLRNHSARGAKADVTTLYQQGLADLEKLKNSIPKKRDFARVLSGLLESASNSAVNVGTITYKPVEIKGENLLSYQLSIAVNGSYAAVKNFLTDIQSNSELLVVDSVSFSNSDLFVENVIMNLQITVYLREGA